MAMNFVGMPSLFCFIICLIVFPECFYFLTVQLVVMKKFCYQAQIYLAPSLVSISGNLTVLERSKISLTCHYSPGVPEETRVSFHVNGEELPVSYFNCLIVLPIEQHQTLL